MTDGGTDRKRRAKGTGTVRFRSGSWYASWWVIDGGTGKRAQRSKGGFPTEAKAERYLRSVLVRQDTGQHVDVDRKISVGELLERWLVAKQVEGRRATTLAGYKVTIEKWIKPRLGAVKAAALTTEQVDEALADLLTCGGRGGQPLSPRSVQLAGTVLRMALSWGVKRRHLARNVAADAAVPSAGHRTMTTWTAQQAARYIAAARQDREGAVFVLALLRGMRRGELCGLRWSAVDLDGKALQVAETTVIAGGKITGSTPKTDAGKRRVPLDDYLVTVLREHRKQQIADRLAAGTAWHDTGYLFTDEIGQPLKPDHVSDRHERICAAAGLERVRMHDLRHSAASLMLANGTPVRTVSELLGHADPAITLRVYSHVIPGHADAAAEALTASIVGS
jgi:integrase